MTTGSKARRCSSEPSSGCSIRLDRDVSGGFPTISALPDPHQRNPALRDGTRKEARRVQRSTGGDAVVDSAQAVAVAAGIGLALALLVDHLGLGLGEKGRVLELAGEFARSASSRPISLARRVFSLARSITSPTRRIRVVPSTTAATPPAGTASTGSIRSIRASRPNGSADVRAGRRQPGRRP